MSKIKTMLQLQQELNDSTNGKGWENGLTKNGKPIDWRRCIYLELAELVESYPWKHWKNIDAKPDYENIKIETVDIWHFIMSEALRVYKSQNLGDIDALARQIESTPSYQELLNGNDKDTTDYYQEISAHEELLRSLFCENSIDKLVSQFLSTVKISNLNLDSLYALYIGKNILNKFRQDNGYKDGTYIKIWNGKEDNVIMQDILSSKSDISPVELYDELNKAYCKND